MDINFVIYEAKFTINGQYVQQYKIYIIYKNISENYETSSDLLWIIIYFF